MSQVEKAPTVIDNASSGEEGPETVSQPGPPWRHWSWSRRCVVLLCIGIIPLAAWRIRSDWRFWSAAWSQGTLDPGMGTTSGPQSERSIPLPFDIGNLKVPTDEVFVGGPGKDGIPALTDPELLAAGEAKYLTPSDRVIGVSRGTEAKAYPLKILNYHEIVNDRIGEVPIAVTYCPLCDSSLVFDRRTQQGEREFGVSGLLYNSNVLMYDRGADVESLWSQMKTEGISGPNATRTLSTIPLEVTTWEAWRARHPGTQILSPRTGHDRDYASHPYEMYFSQPDLMFPARPSSDRLPVKAPVLGVWSKTAARAYPLDAFDDSSLGITDSLDGKRLTLAYDPEHNSLRVAAADSDLQWAYAFWFAWYAFHPETDVYGEDES